MRVMWIKCMWAHVCTYVHMISFYMATPNATIKNAIDGNSGESVKSRAAPALF